MNSNPSQDIYKMMDKAGIGITKFSTPRSMSKIINEIRTTLAADLEAYILERDKRIFEAGRQKGMADAKAK